MERTTYSKLIDWKNNPHRKPLVVKGARQVGKTYLINEFAEKEFENSVILNCDKDSRIAEIFSLDLDPARIIKDISILAQQEIKPGKTLLFIDEITDAPRALAALKYFCEDLPQYHVIVAGSLLGLAIHKGVSFPVGKVDELTLYPVSLPEFVHAKLGKDAFSMLMSGKMEDLCAHRTLLINTLREYYYTGGMPEVVQAFVEGRNHVELRNIQKQIIADYAMDISKHANPSILGRIHQIWNSIPQQLAKNNSKFIYGNIQKGARAKEFETAIEWLIDAGLVYRVPRVRKPGVPLKYYEDFSSFKLFMVDHGLMGAMVDASASDILLGSNVFEEFKGTLTEQYVFEQMRCSLNTDIFYYNSQDSKLELDFLVQGDGFLVPVEVKAEENLRAKSLRQFYMDNPGSRPVRLSMSDYRKQDWMTNIPLYAACRIPDFLS